MGAGPVTTYAIVVDDTILKIGSRPKAYLNHTGLQYATDEQLAAIGILPVVDTPRPADTATHTTERSVELVAGVPTVVWTSRPWTAEELAARTAEANATLMRADVDQALDGLRAIINSSGTLTGAQLSNAVRLLARVLLRLCRFQLGKLDAAD
jgi:hypothetical protein